MNIKQGLSIAVLALAVNSAFAAGSPGVERNTQGFLNALAAGGGKPLEQLSPKDARAVLVGAQAGVKVDVSGIKVADKISAWAEAVQIAGFSEGEADRFFGKPEALILRGLEIRLRPPAVVRVDYVSRHAELLSACTV